MTYTGLIHLESNLLHAHSLWFQEAYCDAKKIKSNPSNAEYFRLILIILAANTTTSSENINHSISKLLRGSLFKIVCSPPLPCFFHLKVHDRQEWMRSLHRTNRMARKNFLICKDFLFGQNNLRPQFVRMSQAISDSPQHFRRIAHPAGHS